MKRRRAKKRKERSSSASGRIKVFVRVRPLAARDLKCPIGKEAVRVANADMTQVKVVEGKTEKTFEFDQLIPPETGNDEVYKIIGKPLVEACLTGMNGILMAYGQTGAGKTYTLMAPDGITANIVNTIFSIVERDQMHSYSITCSYLQIYQERIYDLLCAGKMREVFLREHPKKGVFVDHLSELLVKSPEEIKALFMTGRKRLAFAETKMNRHSSRSHAICQLKIERINMPTRYGVFDAHACSMTSDGELSTSTPSFEAGYRSGDSAWGRDDVTSYFDYEEDDDIFSKVNTLTRGAATVRGRLYICDLAGSERIKKTKAQGERLHEAQAINSSLLELGNVIHALAEGKNNHIPFRNSILTRFLQDGLSGNSRTSLIVCVSPSLSDVNETLCSLKFGLRAMKVESTAQVNIEVDYEKMARQLAETLEIKEQEWRRVRADYESYIVSLKASHKDHDSQFEVALYDQGLPDKTEISPWQKSIADPTEESLKNQTKALLLVELISMELFYGLEDLLREGGPSNGKEVPTNKLYALTDRDLLLHSAETLLELTEYFFTKSTSLPASNTPANSHETSDMNAVTSAADVPNGLVASSSYAGKLHRVRSTLCRIKESTDKAAVQFLSRLLEKESTETEIVNKKRRLHEALREYVQRRMEVPSHENVSGVTSVVNLEQSLCHVLIDKALINCILLLDKTEMEKQIKQLREDQARFDLAGADTSPLLVFRKKSSEESSTRSDGRLISVDEGVVLEGSESTNSREKLTHHLESSSLAEMEAENRALCEKNAEIRKRLDDTEKRNETLNVELSDAKKKLRQSKTKLTEVTNNNGVHELTEKLKQAELKNQDLLVNVQRLEGNLEKSRQIEAEKKKETQQLGGCVDQSVFVEERKQLASKLGSSEGRCLELETKMNELKTNLQNEKLEKTKEEHLTTGLQDEIKKLRTKLTLAETKNNLFISKAESFEQKLKEVGQLIARHKENERTLEIKTKKLEAENVTLRRSYHALDEGTRTELTGEPVSGATSEGEPQVLRETIVERETAILLKDQQILCLKNEAVDLMSEVSKLDAEYNELSAQRLKLDKDMKEQSIQKDEVEGELQSVLRECSKLRCDVLALMDENNGLRQKIESTSHVLKSSVSSVLSERNVLERDLQSVQQREKELESLSMDFEAKNNKLLQNMEQRELTVNRLQLELDELLSEKSRLNFSLSEVKDVQLNTAEENEALQHDMKMLEKNLTTLQASLKYCLNEKISLKEEMSIKGAELDTLRTYASLCAEETRSMKTQIELYKETERVLNTRVDELELSLEDWRQESLRMKDELSSIEEDRRGLDKRIHEASRAIDRVKEELISLMHIVLGLQKDLLCLVDGILVCLGLDDKQFDLSRQRLLSYDSGYTSTATEASSERSSGGSDSNYAVSLSTCVLIPDEQCLVNPSEISVIRENKTEIFRLHEELKMKLLVVKDFLERFKENEPNSRDTSLARSSTDVEPAEISGKTSGGNLKEFPYLNKTERAKLTKLLSVLKRAGEKSEGGEYMYDIYSRLEGKLSGLSSQLATKELEICHLLKEKMKLQHELMKSKYGITLCEHCLNDPDKVNQSNELLRANLLSYMEDTARLESEIMDFAQYKAKLEHELDEVRAQITELEDEIIESPSNISRAETHEAVPPSSSRVSSASFTESNSGSDTTDSEKKNKKRVTFDKMVPEPKENSTLRRRRHREEKNDDAGILTQEARDKSKSKVRKLEQEVNATDGVDLCALLESIPIDAPINDEPELEPVIVESVNRLSAYDNMSFQDKVQFVVERQNSEEHPIETETLTNTEQTPPDKRHSVEGSNCKMCGLLRKKGFKNSDDAYVANK